MFKGSAHLPDGLMDKLLEGAGGWSNAFTSSDMTVYQNVAERRTSSSTMLWIDADRLAGLLDTFDKPKLDNQRDVVLNERRQSYENQPYGMASCSSRRACGRRITATTGRRSAIRPTSRRRTVPDVAEFFRKYYVPNNATMVIAGDVKFDEVKKLVEKYFAWIPKGAEPARPQYKTPRADHEGDRDQHDRRRAGAARVPDVARPGAASPPRSRRSIAPPRSSATASRAGSTSASSTTRRSRRTSRRLQRRDSSAATFQIVATAKPGVDPKRLITEISEEVAKLAGDAPDAKELERAQNSHEAGFLDGLEPTLQRAIQLAAYDVFRRTTPTTSRRTSRASAP